MGLASGALFCLVCCTGFFLGLHPHLETYLRSSSVVQPTKYSTEQLLGVALKHPSVDRIEIPSQSGSPWKLRTATGYSYLDPSTGEILKPLLGNSYNIVKKLHRWLLLESSTGRTITGIATLIYLMLMLSGFYLWCVKCYRNLARGLTFRRQSGWKRTLYDAHLVLGVYALLPLFIMASTGLYWSYREPYKAALYQLLDGDAPPLPVAKSKPQTKALPRTDLPYSQLLQVAQQELSAEGTLRLQLPTVGENKVTFSRIRTPGFWRFPIRDEVILDGGSGTVVTHKPFHQRSRAEKATMMMYDIHTGHAWGELTLVIWLIATLCGATLPISGTLMWWNRLKSQRKAQKILAKRRQTDSAQRSM